MRTVKRKIVELPAMRTVDQHGDIELGGVLYTVNSSMAGVEVVVDHVGQGSPILCAWTGKGDEFTLVPSHRMGAAFLHESSRNNLLLPAFAVRDQINCIQSGGRNHHSIGFKWPAGRSKIDPVSAFSDPMEPPERMCNGCDYNIYYGCISDTGRCEGP